jgi:hypothetical protein
MSKTAFAALACLPLALVLAAEQPAEPVLYDLVINGEPFTIEANRTQKLQSKTRPGATYEVALRIAQIQRLALNSLQLDYDRGFHVTDDRGRTVRTATLRHELGFTMIVSDLGKSYDSQGRQTAFEALTASLHNTLKDDGAGAIKTSAPAAAELPPTTVSCQQIHYVDKSGSKRISRVYLLGNARFTASCIVQYLEEDAENALPLVKATLDTLRAR